MRDFSRLQWLRLRAPSAGGSGPIPGQGAGSHVLQLSPQTVQASMLLRASTKNRHSRINIPEKIRAPRNCIGALHSHWIPFRDRDLSFWLSHRLSSQPTCEVTHISEASEKERKRVIQVENGKGTSLTECKQNPKCPDMCRGHGSSWAGWGLLCSSPLLEICHHPREYVLHEHSVLQMPPGASWHLYLLCRASSSLKPP